MKSLFSRFVKMGYELHAQRKREGSMCGVSDSISKFLSKFEIDYCGLLYLWLSTTRVVSVFLAYANYQNNM
jgi:hypothetical protein